MYFLRLVLSVIHSDMMCPRVPRTPTPILYIPIRRADPRQIYTPISMMLGLIPIPIRATPTNPRPIAPIPITLAIWVSLYSRYANENRSKLDAPKASGSEILLKMVYPVIITAIASMWIPRSCSRFISNICV